MDEHIIQARQQDFEAMAGSTTETVFTFLGRVKSVGEDYVTFDVDGHEFMMPIAAVIDYDDEPFVPPTVGNEVA